MKDAIQLAIDAARQARAAGDLREAEEKYTHAAELARTARHIPLLAHALRHVSDIARERGFAKVALAAGEEAVSIYRRDAKGLSLDLANALRGSALALQALDRPSEAKPVWQEAYDLYDRLGVSRGVSECSSNIENASKAE